MGVQRVLCIQGGTVVLPEKCVSGGTVLIARGKIAYAGKRRAEARGICPGFYIEGPFVSPEKRGGIQPKYVRGVDLAYLRRLARVARGRLCMMTFAPELDGAAKLVKAMRALSIRPCIGHSAADAATVAAVSGKRPINVTHLFNAMSGLDHKRPGVAAFALDKARVFVELNPDGVHVAPPLLRLVRTVKPADRVILMSDAVISSGMPAGEYVYVGMKVSSSAAGVHYLKEGTLVGSSILLNEGVSRYMKFTGAPLHEAIQAASLNPAEFLGLSSRTGSLEEGKQADIVLFTRDLKRATAAFRGGRAVAL
jgi:N-acetylglucosamine-6-phosphate deacetylase